MHSSTTSTTTRLPNPASQVISARGIPAGTTRSPTRIHSMGRRHFAIPAAGLTAPCVPASPNVIHDFGGTLTNNPYPPRSALVGFGAGARPGYAVVCGFAFSMSQDLIKWTRPQVFAATDAPAGDQTR